MCVHVPLGLKCHVVNLLHLDPPDYVLVFVPKRFCLIIPMFIEAWHGYVRHFWFSTHNSPYTIYTSVQQILITNTQGLESGLKTLPRYQFQLVSASGFFTPSVICTAPPLRSLTHRSQTRNCMGTHALNYRLRIT